MNRGVKIRAKIADSTTSVPYQILEEAKLYTKNLLTAAEQNQRHQQMAGTELHAYITH